MVSYSFRVLGVCVRLCVMYEVCICMCEETRSQCGVAIALHFLLRDRAYQRSW